MGIISHPYVSDLKSIPAWVFISIPIVLLIFRFLITGIYNVYFHPLSKIPGPKSAAFTQLVQFYHMLTGRNPYHVKALHDKYGPMVRVGPEMISFSSASAWKDIYGHVGGRQQFLKSPMYDNGSDSRPPSIAAERDPAKHGKIRRLSSHAFSAKALNDQEDIVQEYIDLLINQIDAHATKTPQEMVQWYNFATFDIVGDLAFGEAFGSLADGKKHFWVETILDSLTAGLWTNLLFTSLGNMRLTNLLIPKWMMEKREQHFEYAQEKVTKRINSKTTRKDFFSKLLQEKDAYGYDVEYLTVHSSVLVVAGSETTATFMSGVTYYLCRTPDAYKKLVTEIRSTFKEYSHITGHATEACTYLNAVINEGMRIYPPVPIGLPRLSPGETVDGVFIPKGTEVSVSSWSATHSEENFHRPYEFIPERWIDKECQDKLSASQPFLIGSRVCLGRNLAMMEMRCILAKMLWMFDMELMDDQLDWESEGTSNPLWRKPRLMVKYTRRDGVALPPKPARYAY